MKIVHITNYFMEKLNYQDTELPIYQAKLGHEISIITSERYYPFENYSETYDKILGRRIVERGNYDYQSCMVYRLKPNYERSVSSILILPFLKTINILKKTQPDVIHIHGELNFSLFPAIAYAIANKTKIFIDCHADLYNFRISVKAKLLVGLFKYTNLFFKKMISGYLPVTKSSGKYLKECLGVKDVDIKLLPLGAKGEWSKFIPIKNEVSFVYSGKISEEKKIIESLDIVQHAVDIGLPYQVVFNVIGEFSNENIREMMISKINSVNYKVNIYHFLPFHELVEIYKKSHVGMWLGSASNSIQDCSFSGAIVFVSNSLVTEHLNLDGKLVLESDEIKKSGEKLMRIFESKYNICQLASNSNNMISKFSWHEIAKESIRIYSEHD